ncbi:MAG TPA: hypothetical protein VG826_01330 [Pirellulales bacterium]|nr:hypothetical protein [Pirellulales bacterium]
MKIFARHSLTVDSLGSDEELLLEGSWPSARCRLGRWSLDETIDARFAWIDALATEYAQRTAQPGRFSQQALNLAYINELSLRYYFVKLLRIAAFFRDVRPIGPGETIEVHLSARGDEAYADLLEALATARGAQLKVCWQESSDSTSAASRPPLSWRRWAARARKWRFPPPARDEGGAPRVVLCGNPRILNPVCAELIGRGARVWWLYERFAVRCWWRWCRAGVEQLVCDSEDAVTGAFKDAWAGSRLWFEDVELTKPVERWLEVRAGALGAQQSVLIERVETHFRELRPTALVLDEDATPLKRIATTLARRHGALSVVIQHGAPCGRFGFAPLAADRICVWGQAAKQQLVAWGVPNARIHLAGWPGIGRQLLSLEAGARGSESRAKRFLLLAGVPPRDERPDGVEFHLTVANHAAMLGMLTGVLDQIAGARLTVKLHPRAATSGLGPPAFWANFPVRIERSRDLAGLLSQADCVLSCASTAGIEAALAGAPVIQLLPAGSGNVLPAEEWGLVGSARTAEELATLIPRALARGWRREPETAGRILADYGRRAAARIADELIGPANQNKSQIDSTVVSVG